MSNLRSEVSRLAAANPDLRKALFPLLRQAAKEDAAVQKSTAKAVLNCWDWPKLMKIRAVLKSDSDVSSTYAMYVEEDKGIKGLKGHERDEQMGNIESAAEAFRTALSDATKKSDAAKLKRIQEILKG